MKFGIASLDEIGDFDEIIDVRSPAEFTDDHIPGASNCPVLDNDERARIGTIYTQQSPFAARKLGAALVSRNIARHLEERFSQHDKHWRPLVYCWRGGQRSGSLATVLRAVGWNTGQLEGGYKAYRRQVLERLETLPHRFNFRVLSGPTGSGKSRLLQFLAAEGGQVLDLETLAAHKGSVLGVLPDTPQPSQKGLETAIVAALQAFDPAHPVYAEAESRKIGMLSLPTALLEQMRASPCLTIETSLAARVEFLCGDYAYFIARPDWLMQRLQALHGQHGRETLARWQTLADTADWPTLVRELLEQHYDPHYRRSQNLNYANHSVSTTLSVATLSDADLRRLAKDMLSSTPTGKQSCA